MGKPPFRVRLKDFLWSLKENKKVQIWIMIAVLVLLLSLLVLLMFVFNNDDDQVDSDNLSVVNIDLESNVERVGPQRRFIDGITVDPGDENILPVAVMIENLVTIRPQAGLQAASVVYEALAEGGITRFMAIYAGVEQLREIGPVRSARHYFVDWAEEYKGVYAHAGGSPQGLGQLYGNEFITKDLNQIAGDHAYFWRDGALAAPHNLFTSSELLEFAKRDNDLLDKVGQFTPWKFVVESEAAARPIEEKSIKLPFSGGSYDVEYKYDSATNDYLRFNGGKEHVDRLIGEQLRVKNVLVQYVSTSLLEADTGRIDIETEGEGDAILFRDGVAIEGKWSKESRDDRTQFSTLDEDEMEFIPGNIWVEVLPDDRTVEYN